ncbi:hypothetical protein BT63DRAFT_465502 [Microthyrium microscopicum]|uniref:Cell wall protein n=1 Tax=Microthyrium microscopicum TaxID=703497 RepID=A0A6A6TUU2_9PEZI|nr:hypothetical protein BT63DRAFT_465502 [Microthyrium microscopicum]
MRFSVLLAPLLAVPSLAGLINVEKRQASILTGAFADLNTKLNAFDQQVSALTPSSDVAKSQSQLVAASQAILNSMKTGEAAIKGAKPLGLLEVTGLISDGTALATNAQKVLADLTSKQDIIKKANLGPLVVTQLKAQKAAADTFAKATTDKLPTGTQTIGGTLITAITNALDSGIKIFS